jgi:hypothetical protein
LLVLLVTSKQQGRKKANEINACWLAGLADIGKPLSASKRRGLPTAVMSGKVKETKTKTNKMVVGQPVQNHAHEIGARMSAHETEIMIGNINSQIRLRPASRLPRRIARAVCKVFLALWFYLAL